MDDLALAHGALQVALGVRVHGAELAGVLLARHAVVDCQVPGQGGPVGEHRVGAQLAIEPV